MAVKSVLIPPEADGMKAVLFLRRFLPSLPESAIRKIFDTRDIKLDNIRISRNTQIHAGQILSVFLPSNLDNSYSLRIIYEDNDVLLVNKPAGISVVSDKPGDLSLSDLCRMHSSSATAVHRLDNKTSGLCLFAKNENALGILIDAFRFRTVEKYYTCLIRGVMKPSSAVCNAFLIKDSDNAVVHILDHNAPGSLPIITGYETLESGPISRLRVHLITGRTHQIRAHLAALGHPILGDDLYGDRDFNHQQKSRSLKLCATELSMNTNRALPNLDGKRFQVDPPF